MNNEPIDIDFVVIDRYARESGVRRFFNTAGAEVAIMLVIAIVGLGTVALHEWRPDHPGYVFLGGLVCGLLMGWLVGRGQR